MRRCFYFAKESSNQLFCTTQNSFDFLWHENIHKTKVENYITPILLMNISTHEFKTAATYPTNNIYYNSIVYSDQSAHLRRSLCSGFNIFYPSFPLFVYFIQAIPNLFTDQLIWNIPDVASFRHSEYQHQNKDQ